MTVRHMIKPDSHWDWDGYTHLLPMEVILKIVSIWLPVRESREDYVIW